MGQALNLVGALLAGLATLLSATVTSVSGDVPILILAPLVATGFLVRLAGVSAARRAGRWTMGWGYRIGSWVFFGAAALLIGFIGATGVVGVLAAFLVLDGAAGLVQKDLPGGPSARPKSRFPWRRVAASTLLIVYLGGVAAYHVLLSNTLSYGKLVTWSLLALAFCVVVLVTLRGQKARDPALHPPPQHRLHERREQAVVDPERARAEAVILTFRARGDAGPFLAFVREAGRNADFPERELDELEQRLLAHFARAGTRRDQDILAALDEVEGFLSLRNRTLEIRR